MKRRAIALVLSLGTLFFADPAFAMDPRELLSRCKAGIASELEGARRPRNAATLQAQEGAHEALVDQKNQTQSLVANEKPTNEFTTQLVATAGTPVQVGYSGGSTYPFIYFDPRIKGRAYAVSDSAGFYRSDNGGVTWQASNTGIANLTIASFAVSQSNANILYAHSTIGMHRSLDAGRTWTYFANTSHITARRLSNYRNVAISATDANRVYVGSATGQVHLTTNGGTTWTQVGTLNVGVPISAVHLARNGRVFVGTSKGLYIYNNNAWQKITMQTDSAYDIVSTISSAGVETIYVTDGNQVARTAATGVPVSFTRSAAIPPNLPTIPGYINRLAIRIKSTGVTQIIATQQREWAGRSYYSYDHGVSWRDLGPNNGANFVHDASINPTRVWKKGGASLFVSATFDPFNEANFILGDDWGIWRSTDWGNTFRESVKGTPNIIGTELVYDPIKKTYLMSSMDNGVVEYNPATNTWKSVFPVATTSARYFGHVWKTVVMPNGNRIVSSAPWNAPGNSIHVIRPDGTVTLANGIPAGYPRTGTVWAQGYIRSIVVDPTNANRLYAGLDGDGAGLFISNDGGFNWTRSTTQPADLRVYRMAIDPVTPTTLYWGTMWAGSTGGLFRSTNSGQTWTRVYSGGGFSNVGDIVVAQDGAVYMGGQNAAGGPVLYVSRNRGVSFTLLKTFDHSGTPGPLQAITVDPANPRRIIVSSRKWTDHTGARIWATDDAGATWTDISAGLPNTSGAAKMLFAPDGRSIYVVMNAGTLFRIPLA